MFFTTFFYIYDQFIWDKQFQFQFQFQSGFYFLTSLIMKTFLWIFSSLKINDRFYRIFPDKLIHRNVEMKDTYVTTHFYSGRSARTIFVVELPTFKKKRIREKCMQQFLLEYSSCECSYYFLPLFSLFLLMSS